MLQNVKPFVTCLLRFRPGVPQYDKDVVQNTTVSEFHVGVKLTGIVFGVNKDANALL